MALSALESVEDAFDGTKRLLWPFARGTWFRLAAVMLFVGAGGFSPTSFLNFGMFPGDGTGEPPGQQPEPQPGGPDPGALTPELTPELLVFLVLFVLLAVAVFLLWQIASAVIEFVFVESLGAEAVKLREFFTGNVRPGVRLFLFRTGVSLLVFGGLVVALLAVGILVGGWPVTQWDEDAILALVFLGIPLLLGAAFVLGLVLGLTTTFVVPTMLAEDRGVFSAWRRFLGVVADEPVEILVYLVVNFVLGIAIGLATGALTLALLIVVGVPALLVSLPVLLTVGVTPLGGTVLLVVWLAAGVLFFVASLLIAVPFQTFRRYYALLVLGDVDADLDVVPTTRAAVRADGGEEPFDDEAGTDAGNGGDAPGVGGDAEGGDRDGGAWNVDRGERGSGDGDDPGGDR